MTLQNRVDPWGKLNAVSARGAWLGNRGIIHNENKEIVAQWRHKAWVTCKLEFKGAKRTLFGQGSYTELFFLDEATALSAGHRPCAECRRDRYNEFKSLWCLANLEDASTTSVPIANIDKQLHSERALRGGEKVTFQTEFGTLPDGVFVDIKGISFLLWQGILLEWSPHGYSKSDLAINSTDVVTVLTPASIVKLFSKGFKPQVHETAVSC
jgi:hypothetical protein